MFLIMKKKRAVFIILLVVATILTGCIEKVERTFYGVPKNVYLEDLNLTGYFKDEVRNAVANLAIERNKDPQNARFNRDTGEVIPGIFGRKVNVNKTVQKILTAKKNTRIKLIFEELTPKYGTDEIEMLKSEKGSYVTGVGGSEQRYHNIQLATKTMNYFIVYPGEIFSFNKVVGPRTEERGYQPAPIMSEGGSFLGPGGGVCQVASTLFNAANNAGLKIVERHHHARPVGYVPPGMDATVDFAWLDLKFQNNTDHPVVVRGEAVNRSLRIWINGLAKE